MGLEVHLQIASRSKLFSQAPTAVGPANAQVAFFDAAIPGTLPVLNRRCVEAAVQTALALNCEEINTVTRFDRKHYFYADMPAGFQITQQFQPIARKGTFSYYVQGDHNAEPRKASCRITQVQIEQDSGKSIHDPQTNSSLIDLNRAGIGLLEIVFEPDLSTGEEAACLVKDLIAMVKTLGVCSGRMDEGAVRVDANVSVHKPGTPLGTRTEIKNMNSVKAVKNAVDFEIRRQIKSLSKGRPIANVTMTFDSETGSTVVMRDKEMVQDYRFFPEPNIPLVALKQVGICVETLRKSLPPLPAEHRNELMERFGLSFRLTLPLVREPGYLEMFHETMRLLSPACACLVTHFLLLEVGAYLREHSVSLVETKLTGKNLAQVILMKEERKANHVKCVEVLHLTMKDGKDPLEILKEKNWALIDDVTLLSGLIDEAIAMYPKEVRSA